MSSDCDFCLRLLSGHRPRNRLDFYTLEKVTGFVVVAALGAIAPGHILIVATEHISAMAQLTERRMTELVALARRWQARLAQTWGGEIVLFEHGSVDSQKTSGACVVHAHWQMVPVPNGGNEVPEHFHPIALEDLRSLLAGREYLLFSNDVGSYVAEGPGVKSQYFRRRILTSLGRSGEWDYLAFPNEIAMEETISELKASPNNDEVSVNHWTP